MTPPKLPVYDRTSGQNPFVWIVSEAAKIRQQRLHTRVDMLYLRAIARANGTA